MPRRVVEMKDPFDDWIRGAIPEIPEDKFKKEIHLAILKERMRARGVQRQHRGLRWGMIAAPLVLLILFFGNVVELGGDGFDLVEVEGSKDSGRILLNEFRGVGFNVYEDETEAEIRELNQQLAAGEGVVVGVEGWIIQGHANWGVIREYTVFGKKKTSARTPESPPTKNVAKALVQMNVDWDALDALVKSGDFQPEAIEPIELDGILFSVQRWSIPTEEYGTVIHYSGVPVGVGN